MSDSYAAWREQFAEADPTFGPVPLWWWDAETVTAERIRWQMEQFRRGGLRNVCIINLAPSGPNAGSPGSDPPFYSEAWWDLFGFAVREGERLGIGIWYYDQIGFSGANFPARLATDHPEYRGYRLTRWRPDAVPTDAEILGRDAAWVYGVVRAGFNWLDDAACRTLFDTIHGEMERRFGPYLGTVIRGSFQDELPPLPNWDPRLVHLYRETYGENLIDQLPELFQPSDHPSAARRRVFSFLAGFAEAAFFRPLGEWHRAHGLLWGCDQAGPGRAADPYGAQRLYLDYPRTHRWFLAPGNDPDGEIKFHASLAHLYGAPRVWFEAFHSSGWGGTIEDTVHWLIPWLAAGATLYNPHAVYFATVGGWWEWAAPDTGWRQPYWEHYPILADTVARVCRLLSAGRHVADIAVYYPGRPIQESIPWPHADDAAHPMELARNTPPGRVRHIVDSYWELVGRQDRHRPDPGILRSARWDFDVVDDDALATARINDDGTLSMGPERYRVLILPGTERLDAAAAARVRDWVAAGGLVLGYRVLDGEATFDSVAVFSTADALIQQLEQRLERRVRGPGLSLVREAADGTRVYFLTPTALVPMHRAVGPSDRPPETARYWLEGRGNVELWEPTTGHITPLEGEPDGPGVTVDVPFVDWPAAVVVMRPTAAPSPTVAPSGPSLAAPTPRTLSPSAVTLPETGWTVTVDPTLDNRYGDFDRHGRLSRVHPEIRRFQIRVEGRGEDGIRAGWFEPPSQDAADTGWHSRLWSETGAWRLVDRPLDSQSAEPIGQGGEIVVVSPVFGDLSYRDWAGRMGRVPRLFLNLGRHASGSRAMASSYVHVPEAGRYWVVVEGAAVKSVRIAGTPVIEGAGAYAATRAVALEAGWLPVEVIAESLGGDAPVRVGLAVQRSEPPPLPQWVHHPKRDTLDSRVTAPAVFRRAVLFAAVDGGAAAFSLNGREIVRLGEFAPYRPEGQHAIDVTALVHPGDNRVTVRFLSAGSGAVLVDGYWEDMDGRRTPWALARWTDPDGQPVPFLPRSPEGYWLLDRPHLLPRVGWLHDTTPPAEVLPWVLDPEAVGQPIWLRAPLPVGARRLLVHVRGAWTAWVDGKPASRDGNAVVLEPGPAGRWLVLRVEPDGDATEAAVLESPIYVETVPSAGTLGNWQTALGLPTFSGAVDYETTVTGSGHRAVLDLGYVRGTSAVYLDGRYLGARLWHPHRYDCSPAWGPGPHRLRIRVTNTLGAFYSDGKPTSLNPPDQWPGGLFGPVRLAESD